MRIVTRGGPLLACLVLLGCAAEQTRPVEDAALRPRDLCRRISSATLEATRDSFVMNFAEAERGFGQVLDDLRATPAGTCPEAMTEPEVLASLGLALSSQGQFRLAEASFSRAEALMAAVPPELADRARARVDGTRAMHSLNRRDAETARALASQAAARLQEGAEKLGAAVLDDQLFLDPEGRDTRVSTAAALNAKSWSEKLLNDTDAASRSNADALAVLTGLEGSAQAVQARLLTQDARILLQARNYPAALDSARRAVALFAVSLPDSALMARARMQEGAALAALNDTAAALAAFSAGLDILERSASPFSYDEVYPYIALLLAERAADRIPAAAVNDGVFRALQVIRSPKAAADISASVAGLEEGDSEKARIIRDTRLAEEKLSQIKAAQGKSDTGLLTREDLDRAAAAAFKEVARLSARRDAIAPEYRAATGAAISLAELQAALSPGEVLVQIATGRPESTLIYVTRDAVEVRNIQASEEIFSLIIFGPDANGLRFQMSEGTPYAADFAWKLYQVIFRDLGPKLLGQKRLFVSTSGALQGFPFEALLTAEPPPGEIAQDGYAGLAWLGDALPVSYLPAVRNLIDLRARAATSAAPKSVMAFGDFVPSLSAADFATRSQLPDTCRNVAEGLSQLAALPGTAQEVSRIGDLFGQDATLMTGAGFTETAVKALAESGGLKQFRILHFATHGLLWDSPDCFGEPALTASIGSAEEDGLITSGDIRRMQLDAQLTILSACQTVGDQRTMGVTAENLSSLSQAFLAAGSRAVIASHWSVSDEATAAIMNAFYARVAAARSTGFDEALREAQASVRKAPATSHPYFWAPFVLIGNGTSALNPAG